MLFRVDSRSDGALLQQDEDAARAVDRPDRRSQVLGLISQAARDLGEPAIADRLFDDAMAGRGLNCGVRHLCCVVIGSWRPN